MGVATLSFAIGGLRPSWQHGVLAQCPMYDCFILTATELALQLFLPCARWCSVLCASIFIPAITDDKFVWRTVSEHIRDMVAPAVWSDTYGMRLGHMGHAMKFNVALKLIA